MTLKRLAISRLNSNMKARLYTLDQLPIVFDAVRNIFFTEEDTNLVRYSLNIFARLGEADKDYKELIIEDRRSLPILLNLMRRRAEPKLQKNVLALLIRLCYNHAHADVTKVHLITHAQFLLSGIEQTSAKLPTADIIDRTLDVLIFLMHTDEVAALFGELHLRTYVGLLPLVPFMARLVQWSHREMNHQAGKEREMCLEISRKAVIVLRKFAQVPRLVPQIAYEADTVLHLICLGLRHSTEDERGELKRNALSTVEIIRKTVELPEEIRQDPAFKRYEDYRQLENGEVV